MKETIKPSKSTKTSEVNAQPSNRKEQIDKFTDGIVNRIIPIVNQALINKDKTIVELVQKIADLEAANKQLEAQNNDLDYLLNSGRNKFEHERNKRLKDLEAENKQLKEQNENCPEHDCHEENCICGDDCDCSHNCLELDCNCNCKDHE